MRYQRLIFWALFSFFVIVSISTVSLAAEYREINASEILKQIENGEDVYLENSRILGELNLNEIELKTVPNPKYNELLESELFTEEDLESCGINKDLKIIESNITIYNSTFKNDLDFSSLLFKKSVSFSRVNYSSTVSFVCSNFSNNANFSGSNFGNSAYFMKSTFGDSANFSGSTFGGITGFTESSFGNLTDFSGSTFGDSVYFLASTFGDSANFSGSTFGDSANFMMSTFGDSAQFSGSTFGDSAQFSGSTFGDSPLFWGATFGNFTDFRSATLGNRPFFLGATFGNFTDFCSATFGNHTQFLGATFGNLTDFSRSTFGDSAVFGGGNVVLKDHTYKGATFGNQTIFFEATFGDSADFSGTIFGDSASFSGSTFGDSASFSGSTFGDSAYFSKTTFDDTVDFLGTQFKEITLIGTDFEEMQINWDSLENSLVFDGPTYLKLIQNFRNLEQFEDADAAYFQYRKHREAQKSWIPFSKEGSKWCDILMRLTCGYGVRPLRAFGFGSGIVLAFSLFYWKGNGISRLKDEKDSLKAKNESEIQKTTFSDAFYFSMVTFATIGYGDWYPKDKFRKLVMIEGFLGWLTLGLFLVTLTNVMIRP